MARYSINDFCICVPSLNLKSRKAIPISENKELIGNVLEELYFAEGLKRIRSKNNNSFKRELVSYDKQLESLIFLKLAFVDIVKELELIQESKKNIQESKIKQSTKDRLKELDEKKHYTIEDIENISSIIADDLQEPKLRSISIDIIETLKKTAKQKFSGQDCEYCVLLLCKIYASFLKIEFNPDYDESIYLGLIDNKSMELEYYIIKKMLNL